MSSVLSGEQLVHLQAKTNYELPSSGLKEFEPTNSWLEQKQIQSALDERKALLEGERVEKWNLMMEAEWIPEKHKAEVKRKNKHWEVFGHHSEGKDWLFPEEVLYLMEMNCLECHFGEVALSIQKGYSLLLRSESGCSATEYRVYSHLSRAGYRVMRHLSDLTVTAYELQIRLDQHLGEKKTYNESVSTEEEIPRPDLPPKKIIDLSNNAEVFIKASCSSSSQIQESNDEAVILQEIPRVKPSIEVIELGDSSPEESSEESDSDIEIIEEIPISRTNNSAANVRKRGENGQDPKDDDDILEVTIPKKEIIVATIESSDSEQEGDVNESDSEKSYDGNWKRQQPGKNKKRFVRPTSMKYLTFLAVEEFCLDTRMKIEKDVQNINGTIDCDNVANEDVASSDSVEFISCQPRRTRPRFPVSKTRNEILDMIPTMVKQKIMSVESPDIRLLPDTIKPNRQLYTFNTNSLKARVFSSFRSYRGRRHFHGPVLNHYNPFYNPFQSSHQMTRPPIMPNSTLTQMFGTDIQSVARGMMQFASALLGNGALPQINQTNGLTPLNFQSSSHFNSPRYSSSGYSPRPMYNEPPRSFSSSTHTRFSDSPVDHPPKNNYVQQPFRRFSFGNQDVRRPSENEERNRSRFVPNSRRPRRGYGRNITRPNRPRRPFDRSNASRVGEFKSEREFSDVNPTAQTIDPAYARPDVPVKEESNTGDQTGNFIPVPKNGTKSTEIIDIADDGDNFVPLSGISSRFLKRKEKRRQWKSRKRMCTLAQTDSESSADAIIFLDSPIANSPFSDRSISNVSVKSEAGEATVKQEAVTVKQEDTSNVLHPPLEIDIKNVKFEGVGVKIEGGINVGDVKQEQCNEVQVKAEKDVSVNSSTSVITEPLVTSQELSVKPEPTAVDANLVREVETNSVITPEAMPSTSADASIPDDSNQMETELPVTANEECDRMEVDGSSENEIVDNVEAELDRDMTVVAENVCRDPEENIDRSEIEAEVLSSTTEIKESSGPKKPDSVDSGDNVKNWAEMKKQNVPLGRTRGDSDEEKSSSDEEGDEIQPLLRPKHCKTIGTVLSALQIFNPFTPKVREDIPKLKISFDMYLATDFRKAQRGLPQYRIVVFEGMEPMPSEAEAQLYELRARFEDSIPMLRAVVMPNSVVYYNCSSVSLPVDDKAYKN